MRREPPGDEEIYALVMIAALAAILALSIIAHWVTR